MLRLVIHSLNQVGQPVFLILPGYSIDQIQADIFKTGLMRPIDALTGLLAVVPSAQDFQFPVDKTLYPYL
jgi:hypothetical protein